MYSLPYHYMLNIPTLYVLISTVVYNFGSLLPIQ